MQALQEQSCQCPYCGELISLLLDCTQAGQTYIEDCPVCCQPMQVYLSTGSEDSIELMLGREND